MLLAPVKKKEVKEGTTPDDSDAASEELAAGTD
jgi:hypothetical protein